MGVAGTAISKEAGVSIFPHTITRPEARSAKVLEVEAASCTAVLTRSLVLESTL